MFYEILTWKTSLIARLNAGEMRPVEWEAFIKAATDANCQSMAADMQKRFEHYTKTKEQK